MMKKMRILVTNDDGYQAAGLRALVGILRKYGDLTVIAPKKPQSGMSMALTMGHKPIAVKKISDSPSESWWYLDGTPASCVKFGIDSIFWPQMPDLVVSGINHGSNAATAAIYSGTLGAAMEGAANLIPAIGVSLDSYKEEPDFSAVESMLPGIIDKLLENHNGKQGLFYNVNFPELPASQIKGVHVCHMGMIHWEKEYRPYLEYMGSRGLAPDAEAMAYLENAEEGESIYVMAGEFVNNEGNAHPADHMLLEEGYVTITPHNIDNTDHEEIDRLCAII